MSPLKFINHVSEGICLSLAKGKDFTYHFLCVIIYTKMPLQLFYILVTIHQSKHIINISPHTTHPRTHTILIYTHKTLTPIHTTIPTHTSICSCSHQCYKAHIGTNTHCTSYQHPSTHKPIRSPLPLYPFHLIPYSSTHIPISISSHPTPKC